jgi:hypothetical protein
MVHHKKIYMPTTTGGSVRMFHHRSKGITGIGMGSVLLDGGQGGQSSYDSLDQYISTTRTDPAKGISGKGLDGLSHKLDNLMLKTAKKKHKNIQFNL